jgi:acetyl-CoA C-acetyltransferase
MYIKGAGMTKFGVENRTTQDMIYEATLEALDNAEIGIDDIDAVVVSSEDTQNNGERQRLIPSLIASIFKIKLPMIRVPAVCGGGGAALWTALKLNYDNILVVGAEKLASTNTSNVTDEILMAANRVWEQFEGLVFPAQNALVAQQHMLKYGSTTDDFALVALKNHENAYMNPKARFYKKKVTLEDIKKSPIVASPLRLFDCSLSVNGAAACILSKDKTDIKITGSSLYTDRISAFENKDMTTWDASRKSSKEAYEQAGIGPSDIDFVEIHDAFTPVEIISYEDLGFCEKGHGAEMIRNGTTKLDGKLPVNTSGGLKAKGHPISATGISQIYEIVKQMRDEAGDRQLKNNRKALAQNIGGAGSTVSVHIFDKVGG